MANWWQREFHPQSVLIHAKDHRVGDAFLQVPFYQSARARFPDARMTLVVSLGGTPYATSMAQVIKPYIDEIIEDAHLCDHRGQMFQRERPLGGRRFDLVIDMQKTWWRTLAIRRTRHRRFISASKHYLFSSRRPRRPIKPPHLLDQFMKLLEAAGEAERAQKIAVRWYGEAERRAAGTCLPGEDASVGFVPGAGEAFKRWPLERFCAVAQAQARMDRRPVFILGPLEENWIDQVAALVPEARFPGWRGPGSKPGGLEPLEVAALGERLGTVVTNDCGTAHMLAPSGVAMLSLFGATNPVKYRPATSMLRVLQRESKGAEAIQAISVEDVLDAHEALWRARGRRTADAA